MTLRAASVKDLKCVTMFEEGLQAFYFFVFFMFKKSVILLNGKQNGIKHDNS